jgi:hypothetical protein
MPSTVHALCTFAPSFDPPMVDFAPLYDRLDRALEHLETLEIEVDKFLNSNPYRVEGEGDISTTGYVWHVRVRSQPPRLLSLVAGDCIHNIRSPLDNLAWALSEGAADNLRERTAFVIAADEREFVSQQWRLRALPEAARLLMASVQPFAPEQLPCIGRMQLLAGVGDLAPQVVDLDDPFARSDERGRAEKHPLWVLERLWNDDKHRSAPLVGAISRHIMLKHSGITVPTGGEFLIQMNTHVLSDAGLLVSLAASPGVHSKGDIRLEPIFEIALDKPGEGFAGSVITLLRELHDHVRFKVIPQFAELEVPDVQ